MVKLTAWEGSILNVLRDRPSMNTDAREALISQLSDEARLLAEKLPHYPKKSRDVVRLWKELRDVKSDG